MKIISFLAFIYIGSIVNACQQDPIGNNGNHGNNGNNGGSINGPIGGNNNIPIDVEILAMSLNCTSLWNSDKSNSSSFFKVTCVRNAQKQIVAGTLYTIGVTLNETVCDKSQMPGVGLLRQSNVDACDLKTTEATSYTCVWKYFVQVWLNKYELTEARCKKLSS